MTRATIRLLSIVAVLLYIGLMSLWLTSVSVSGYDARAQATAMDSKSEDDSEEHWSYAYERSNYRWSRTTGEEEPEK